MSRRPLAQMEVLAMLAATPKRITEMTAGLSPAQLRTPPQPDAWSANEVLAHLRACADVWGECIKTILTQDAPTLRALNPTTWIKQTNYPTQAFQPSLHAFATQRADLLATLEPLTPTDWSRMATVTGAGNALERTVLSYAQRLAIHERPHLKQIARIITALR
ncbi:MAG: DinB family protein [Ktedonobacterales bacterium]|nr:DinB family protein [Ktedonobacterales bacterium]